MNTDPNVSASAAHAAAADLTARGHHVHLVADAESVCLSGHACPGTGATCLAITEPQP